MAFNSAKQSDAGFQSGRTTPSGGPAGDAPDPWGVRRAENLLTTLEGILSARVVTTPLGEVSEVHILAQSGLVPPLRLVPGSPTHSDDNLKRHATG